MDFLLRIFAVKKDIKRVSDGSYSHHGHPCPYRNEVEEWSESGTADVAARTK